MATKREVRAAVEELRRFHRIGTEILKGYGRRVTPSRDETNVMDGIRDRYELKAHTVRAIRRFADPERGYTTAELDELCQLCLSEQRNPTSLVVGLTLVRHLLTISNKSKRKEFQRQVIKRGWTHTRTKAELTRRFGFRRHRSGGRRPYIPDDVSGTLLQIDDMVTAWRRWFDRLSGEDDAGLKAKEVRLSDLAPRLRAELRKLDAAFESLQVEVNREQKSAATKV